MAKDFRYRGYDLDQLQSMSIESLLEIFPARQRRSVTRGISTDKRNLMAEIRRTKEKNSTEKLKTHARDMVILPNMVKLTINVHNGKEFIPVAIKPEMIGHYLGEYALTRRRVTHGTPGIGASRSSLYVPLK